MPKHIPECPGIPAIRSSGRETREYQIRLITPMFGGGAEAGEPDPTLAFRGTSIRGQLQFWWRATRGASYSTYKELFMRHAEVWGTTERASPVEIEVRDVQQAVPRPCACYEWNQQAGRGKGGWRLTWESPLRNTALSYVLFPFQGIPPPKPAPNAQPEKSPTRFIENGSFTFRVRFPEKIRKEVETAVWAWVNFGGLGARTRRGCGSLSCPELGPKSESPEEFQEWLKAMTGPPQGDVRQWPTFPATMFFRPEVGSPLEVWDWVIGVFRCFRQGEDLGRNRGQQENRPGRSRFPEPETIRRIMDAGSQQHQPQDWMPDGFPRAEFGLPIVFHFKDEKQGEPSETTLYPWIGGDVEGRMASPLILKPLALQNGRTVPIMLQLVAPGVSQVELQDKKRNSKTPLHAVPVRSREFTSYSDSPMQGRSASGSAVEAFLTYARVENGLQEVTR